jgi:hypothetical protein
MLAFGLEESCPLLTARCLKLLFEKLPHSLIGDPDTTDLLLGPEGQRQLEQRGYASFVFYLFLVCALSHWIRVLLDCQYCLQRCCCLNAGRLLPTRNFGRSVGSCQSILAMWVIK